MKKNTIIIIICILLSGALYFSVTQLHFPPIKKLIGAPFGHPKRILPSEFGFMGTGNFLFSSDCRKIYCYFNNAIYGLNIDDKHKKWQKICELTHLGVYPTITRFAVSPDEKKFAYISYPSRSSFHGNVSVIDIESGKEKTLMLQNVRATSIAWSTKESELIYFSYETEISIGKYRGGINVWSYKDDEQQTVIPENKYRAEICQILPGDYLIYKRGFKAKLYDSCTGKDQLVFESHKIKGKSLNVNSPFKLSPDGKWVAVSFWEWGDWNPYRGIWLVRLSDAKACMVLKHFGDGIGFWNYAMEWNQNGKELHMVLAKYRRGFGIGLDPESLWWWQIIQPKGYPAHIYSLPLDKAQRVFEEKSKKLEDFSDCFSKGIEIGI